MKSAASFASGLLFGAGLIVARMTQPAKIVGFLDFFGAWDPTLAFVMAGAVAVYAVGYRLALRRRRPILEPAFEMPTIRAITPRLAAGSMLFGAGWGLSGFCPGPAIVAVSTGAFPPLVFCAAMILGMIAFTRFLGPGVDART